MPQIQVKVAAAEGLHARPAANFVQAAKAQPVEVLISKEGKEPVSAKSMLKVLGLGAFKDDIVTLSAEGDGAEEALAALAKVIAESE